jgi:hypothetical protein
MVFKRIVVKDCSKGIVVKGIVVKEIVVKD